MSEHREWGERIYLNESITALRNEHNTTVRAYRDAMSELERIGKINDSMCDTIAEMEKAELEYKNENRIDGPFSIVDVMKTRRRMGIPEGNRESIYPKIDILLDRIEELESNAAPIRVPFTAAPPAATHTGPTRAEAEAKIAELKHSRLIPVAFDEFRDWLLPQLPTERAEMPSVDLVAKIIRGNAETIPLDAPMLMRKAEAILTALRPFLRTPTGWELDVTPADIYAVLSKAESGGTIYGPGSSILDLCRSRIRPTFECKECAEVRKQYNDLGATMQQVADLTRAALEGE